jgi:UPF0755 protein
MRMATSEAGDTFFRRAEAAFSLRTPDAWITSRSPLRVAGEREYALPPPPPPPPPKPLRIIFPEGFTRREMGERVAAVKRIAVEKRKKKTRISEAAYLKLTQRSALPGRFAEDGKPRNLEGFLFPATYEFLPRTTTKQLVNKQLTAFRRNWAKLGLGYAKSKNLTPYDVLIIASMVEKETLAPEERPLVAAVIYNRLKAQMPLGIDATIRYGLNVPGTESLRQSHLANPTPYSREGSVSSLTTRPVTFPEER